MTEITELDMDKYIVLKTEDVEKYLLSGWKVQLMRIEEKIRRERLKENKPENHYLILNFDDEIDSVALYANIQKARWKVAGSPISMKVSDIAVALVNAVLKAKEKP